MQVLVEDGPVTVSSRRLDNEKTRSTYATSVNRLSEITGLTGIRMLNETEANMKRFRIHMKVESLPPRPHVRAPASRTVRSHLGRHIEFPPHRVPAFRHDFTAATCVGKMLSGARRSDLFAGEQIEFSINTHRG